jgi:hypothetical protein
LALKVTLLPTTAVRLTGWREKDGRTLAAAATVMT